MRLFRRTVLLATSTILFFGLAGLSPAGDDAADRMEARDVSLSHDAVPAPVVGDHLFASVASYDNERVDGACWTADEVLQNFVLDIENVGGEIILIADGIQQDLADSWRDVVDGPHVEVSLVLAHIVPDRGSEPIVDVVEIDGDGCALSRTLLTAADWFALIRLSQSMEV